MGKPNGSNVVDVVRDLVFLGIGDIGRPKTVDL